MKLAYLILAHTDIEHLERMVESLDYNSDFYIHIDKKSSLPTSSKLEMLNNVYFIERRNVFWGGFSIIEATNHLIEAALKRKKEYSHFILLSGMDYPIKKNSEIHQFFNNNKDINFIKACRIEKDNKNLNYRVKNYYFFDSNIGLNNTIIRKVFRKVIELVMSPLSKSLSLSIKGKIFYPCFGSQWWALTAECCSYLIDYIKDNKEFNQYFKYSFAPDEMYYHTLVFNSKFANETVTQGLEEFYSQGPSEYGNLHIIHPSLTKYYNADDIDEIKSSDKLFVRKVNSSQSIKLLNLIDQYRNEEL